MEKSALTTEKITIQSNDVRKESRNRFYESKEKNAKNVSMDTRPMKILKSNFNQAMEERHNPYRW